MTRDETKKLILIIASTYPNWKPQDLTFTIDTWAALLKDYDLKTMELSFKRYALTDRSGFAPSPGQLLEQIEQAQSSNEITAMEAWGMVQRAMSNSCYHAQEEFDRLPAEVQRAVGSASVLHGWCMDENVSISVCQANFIKTFNTLRERRKKEDLLPPKLNNMITQVAERLMLKGD